MSRWGSATPRDMETPVSVFNRTKTFQVQHGGVFYDIPSGVSLQSPHLAERLVGKYPADVFYGTSDPNAVREPEASTEAPAVEETTQTESAEDTNPEPTVDPGPVEAEVVEEVKE